MHPRGGSLTCTRPLSPTAFGQSPTMPDCLINPPRHAPAAPMSSWGRLCVAGTAVAAVLLLCSAAARPATVALWAPPHAPAATAPAALATAVSGPSHAPRAAPRPPATALAQARHAGSVPQPPPSQGRPASLRTAFAPSGLVLALGSAVAGLAFAVLGQSRPGPSARPHETQPLAMVAVTGAPFDPLGLRTAGPARAPARDPALAHGRHCLGLLVVAGAMLAAGPALAEGADFGFDYDFDVDFLGMKVPAASRWALRLQCGPMEDLAPPPLNTLLKIQPPPPPPLEGEPSLGPKRRPQPPNPPPLGGKMSGTSPQSHWCTRCRRLGGGGAWGGGLWPVGGWIRSILRLTCRLG